jgi:hypothetical protein
MRAMMTREEALSRLWDNKSVNSLSKVECDTLIKEIYDSFGRCKECKYYDTKLGKTPNDGHCKIPRDSEQILWVNIAVNDNSFCSSYEEDVRC